ncbi:hypothetical protein DB30_03367 [Enhygromyxa salina]|uniref:Uncharacterized protein n=1 Tax=Enhygromyxa salina TaxID=215803 RepID=A0A0C1ZLC7_9BACT|nr:hypothetical protein DB30_03367 [Enhygromyxa salina]
MDDARQRAVVGANMVEQASDLLAARDVAALVVHAQPGRAELVEGPALALTERRAPTEDHARVVDRRGDLVGHDQPERPGPAGHEIDTTVAPRRHGLGVRAELGQPRDLPPTLDVAHAGLELGRLGLGDQPIREGLADGPIEAVEQLRAQQPILAPGAVEHARDRAETGEALALDRRLGIPEQHDLQ